MTKEERLRHINLKLQRADKHIADLEHELHAFFQTKPFTIATRRGDRDQPIYYVKDAHPCPDSLALIAGDAVQNLMCTLDHLAYQLICSDTNDAPPDPKRIYFPVSDDEQAYNKWKLKAMLGAANSTVQAIDALKPYKGGEEGLWKLHRLNIIEKHRLLITVGSMHRSVDIGHRISSQLTEAMVRMGANPPPMIELFFFAEPMFPLVPGAELFVDEPGGKIYPDMKFTFQVGIYEKDIIEAANVTEVLGQLRASVQAAVTALSPLLK